MTPKAALWGIVLGFVSIALVTRFRPLFPIIGAEFGE